jgi:arginine deiminase
MVDYDKFVVHSELEDAMKIFVLKKNDDADYAIEEEAGSLNKILEKHLDVDKVTLIKCGDGDEIAAAREQWNDGSNVLALEPGKIIAYDRNIITNKLLKEHGIEVLEIESSELSRGRGGPRCMSMPLFRE